jgi:hypothetical protein
MRVDMRPHRGGVTHSAAAKGTILISPFTAPLSHPGGADCAVSLGPSDVAATLPVWVG